MTKQLLALAAAAGLLAGMGTAALAQSQTPGQQMQEKGSVKGSPGASGYAPGQQMQEKGSVKGSAGASGYAPGHATTGASVKGNADVKANKSGAKAKTDIDASGNVRVK